MIVIVDYRLGNLASVVNALNRLEIPSGVSSDPAVLRKAEALILPGVGAAGEGMKNLKKQGLDKVILREMDKRKPILGICLGMQLLLETSEEGNVDCLGILRGKVKKFKKERKVPQIGWNEVKYQKLNINPSTPLRTRDQIYKAKIKNILNDIPDNSYFYFINSYYCAPEDRNIIVGVSNYGEEFPSIVIKDNIVATQFHPEKSGRVGFQLLENFFKTFI